MCVKVWTCQVFERGKERGGAGRKAASREEVLHSSLTLLLMQKRHIITTKRNIPTSMCAANDPSS